MVKARILGLVILAVMLLSMFVPGSSVVATLASPPQQPVNYSPENGAEEISPVSHTFMFTYVENPDNPVVCAQFQFMRSETAPTLASDNSYDKPLWDSGVTDVKGAGVPVGLLEYGKKYWWHLRVQDDTGIWSAWSTQTCFTVMTTLPPNQPENHAPLDGAKDVAMSPILSASDFSDPDPSGFTEYQESLAASQWQITKTAGKYDSPVLDTTVTGSATSALVSDNTLKGGTTYYWHVRYQDNHGNWSAYSPETSFTTMSLTKAVASFSADKTEVVGGQEIVTFTDASTPSGEIDRWVWDFGDGTTENWTNITRPSSGATSHAYGATNGGSKTVKLTVYNAAVPTGASKTLTVMVHTRPQAQFTMNPAAAEVGQEITITDTSTPVEYITSWEWRFDDGTTETWTAAEREAASGVITHVFKKGSTHTVSLTVQAGDLGESLSTKQITVTGDPGFHFALWMIAVAAAAVAMLAGGIYLVRSRKAK